MPAESSNAAAVHSEAGPAAAGEAVPTSASLAALSVVDSTGGSPSPSAGDEKTDAADEVEVTTVVRREVVLEMELDLEDHSKNIFSIRDLVAQAEDEADEAVVATAEGIIKGPGESSPAKEPPLKNTRGQIGQAGRLDIAGLMARWCHGEVDSDEGYDLDDGFIDNADVDDGQEDVQAQHSGFFVSTGTIECLRTPEQIDRESNAKKRSGPKPKGAKVTKGKVPGQKKARTTSVSSSSGGGSVGQTKKLKAASETASKKSCGGEPSSIRFRSALSFFASEIRRQLKEDNEGASPADIKKMIKGKWGELSDEEKAPYEERARKEADAKRQAQSEKSKERADEGNKKAVLVSPTQNPKLEAPKKTPSAFALFSAQERRKIKAESSGETVLPSEVTKMVKQRWAELSSEDRTPFERQASAAKDEYDKELSRYENQNSQLAGDNADRAPSVESASEDGRGVKRKRDPKAPKRPQSAFAIFSGEARKAIKGENSTLSPSEVTQMVKQRWNDLGAEGQAPFELKSRTVKEEYEAYERSLEQDAQLGGSDNFDASSETGKGKKTLLTSQKKARQDSTSSVDNGSGTTKAGVQNGAGLKAPKKAPTPFALYAADMRKSLKQENAQLQPSEITTKVKERWYSMNADEKAPFEAKSQAAKEQYEIAKAEFDKANKEAEDTSPIAAMDTDT